MIIKKTAVLKSPIDKIPLAYEYDTQSKSVILLEGYLYKIFTKGSVEIVDLTTELEGPVIIMPT